MLCRKFNPIIEHRMLQKAHTTDERWFINILCFTRCFSLYMANFHANRPLIFFSVNNPWGISGEMSFEEFLVGFPGSQDDSGYTLTALWDVAA